MIRNAPPEQMHSDARPSGRPVSRRRRRKPPQPPKKSWLGVILFAFAACVILLAGALTAAVFIFDPATMVRSELMRQVKNNTGRDLTIAGQPYLTFYPNVGISLPDISVSPPPGMEGRPTLQAERLHVAVAVWPLLSGRVVVEEINMDRPIVNLHVDREGRRSWQIAQLAQPTEFAMLPASVTGVVRDVAPTHSVQTASFLAAQSGRGIEGLEKFELRALRIRNGDIQYRDDRSGTMEVLTAVDVNVTGRRLTDPIALDGTFNWSDERLAVKVHLETLSHIVDGRAARARFNLQSRPLVASFNGEVMLGIRTRIAGPLSLSTPSMRALMRLAGTDLPNGDRLGAGELKGTLRATPAEVALTSANFKLEETQSSGDITVEFGGVRPRVKSNLTIAQLDIDKLTQSFADARPVKRTRAGLVPQPSRARQPASIEDILSSKTSNDGAGRFSPQSRNAKKTAGWSKAPFELSVMALLDADAQLKISGLRVAGLAIDKTTMRIALKNGMAQADIDRVELYNGYGRGVMTAGAGDSGLKVGANIAMSDIAAQPLLKDTADLELLSGTARLTANLNGSGRSQYDLMSSLAGTASFIFRDGAIVGWNIPQILRGLQTGRIGDLTQTPEAKTDFSEFTANFNLSRGIANTQDLRMTSPLLRMTGSGNTDIGRRQLDMILRPKLVATLAGQGGQADLSGLEVPVRITGSWDNPNVQLDLAGIVLNEKAVQGAADTVRKLTDQFKGKNAGDIVRGLLNGDKEDGEGNSAGQLLKNLFKN